VASKKNLMASQKSVWQTFLLHMQKARRQIMVAIRIEQKNKYKQGCIQASLGLYNKTAFSLRTGV
jgi:hypothetical protein